MAADATLVSAAFALGKSTVPGDYSDIFNKQYEGLIEFNKQRYKALGDVITTVGKVGGEIVASNKAFNARFKKASNDYTAGINADAAKIYKGGSPQNKNLVDSAAATMDDFKSQISALEEGGDPNKSKKKKLIELYKQVEEFRPILVAERGASDVANLSHAEDLVDLPNSYIVRDDTGAIDTLASDNLQAVAAIQRHPTMDQKALGITYFRDKQMNLHMRYPTNILRGAFEQNKQDSSDVAFLSYQTANLGLKQEGAEPVMNKDEWAASRETSGGFGMIAHGNFLKEAQFETIALKKLHSMVKNKDHTSNTAGNGIIEEMKTASTAVVGKGSKKLLHKDFSRIKVQTYDKYYDIFKSGDANIQYLATNPLTIGYGDTKRTYKDDLAANQDINIAVINQLGIGSDVFTADELEDGKISPLELAKHEDAKIEIIEKLTNPQTESENLIAAGEMAKYWTAHAEAEFNLYRQPDEAEIAANNKANYQKSSKESIYLGLGKKNDSRIDLPRKVVDAKYKEIQDMAKAGNVGEINGWEGSNISRYKKHDNNDKFFVYQVYNPDTKDYETQEVKGKAKQFTFDEVLKDMNFPPDYKRQGKSKPKEEASSDKYYDLID